MIQLVNIEAKGGLEIDFDIADSKTGFVIGGTRYALTNSEYYNTVYRYNMEQVYKFTNGVNEAVFKHHTFLPANILKSIGFNSSDMNTIISNRLADWFCRYTVLNHSKVLQSNHNIECIDHLTLRRMLAESYHLHINQEGIESYKGLVHNVLKTVTDRIQIEIFDKTYELYPKKFSETPYISNEPDQINDIDDNSFDKFMENFQIKHTLYATQKCKFDIDNEDGSLIRVLPGNNEKLNCRIIKLEKAFNINKVFLMLKREVSVPDIKLQELIINETIDPDEPENPYSIVSNFFNSANQKIASAEIKLEEESETVIKFKYKLKFLDKRYIDKYLLCIQFTPDK